MAGKKKASKKHTVEVEVSASQHEKLVQLGGKKGAAGAIKKCISLALSSKNGNVVKAPAVYTWKSDK